MKEPEKFLNRQEAGYLLQELGDEFAVIKNPSYVHPSFELYPLAPKITGSVSEIKAAVMDMDGTTTTTEALCLHSLEYMVRKITGRMSKQEWSGLDKRKDYPHIIGNSTTKHVEHLISTYEKHIDENVLNEAYLSSVIWTLTNSEDPGRVAAVKSNLINLGSKDLLQRLPVGELKTVIGTDNRKYESMVDQIINNLKNQIRIQSRSDRVRAAIDIYYHRYHEILAKIQNGRGEELSGGLLSEPDRHLIAPMNGIGIFIALIKGWLGEEVVRLIPILKKHFTEKMDNALLPDDKKREQDLRNISISFQQNPAKVAVVTSSILYEAKIVLSEVFRVLHSEIENWPVSRSCKEVLLEKFSSYENIYDGFVTATDSSEIRLKPHRDLYSIALHQLGIPTSQFDQVIGFEDSESGTIAIRAAGIGLCLAVPFSDTQHHDFRAASHVLHGGLPEAILKHNVFLKI